MLLSLSKKKGVTLIEVLLVLAIASSILVMIMSYSTQKMNQLRTDKTVLQMQQILNAGLASYVNEGNWPDDLAYLQSKHYLPSTFNNPWGGTYTVEVNSATGNFIVNLDLSNLSTGPATDALLATIAGQLPTGEFNSTTKKVTSLVNIPGQNLNNARAVNFAAIYSSGACVPVPKCPGKMEPQIMVVPVTARGINKTTPLGVTPIAYPLTGFTAFARGGKTDNKPVTLPAEPLDCSLNNPPGPTARTFACESNETEFLLDRSVQYWRVCLSITTEEGAAYPSIPGGPAAEKESRKHGRELGSILAITRCAPEGEKPLGTPFDVFTPNKGWTK